MTPERKAILENRMSQIVDEHIKTLVRQQMEGAITPRDVSERLGELAEIGACIGTAYQALHLHEHTTEALVAGLRSSLKEQGK